MDTSSRHVAGSVSNKSSVIRSAWDLRIGIVAMLIAVLAVHASMFRMNFAYTPGDQSDAAGIAYFIERDYRWVTGAEHGSYWDTTMFYPQRDTATYSDTLLGGLPFYAPFRAAGADPLTAFQLWILIAGCLNYLSLYMLLKKLLGYGEIASNAGAFLFAFGSSRMMQEWHPQLVPECYVVLSLTGLIFLFRDEKRRPIWGAALFFGGLLLQVYTGVYWAFFLVFCVVLALVLALCRSDWRNPLLTRLREQAWPIGCAAVASLVLVAPLLIHSAHTAAQVGTRSYEQVMYLLPGWTSWFQQLPGCLVYGRLYGFFDSHRNPSWWEDSNGLGFATTAIICLGFWAGRRRPLVALLGLVSVASVILTLRLPSGWSLWAGVYYMFPGANGVRAICRIAVFLTLPFAVAAATWIQGRAPRAGLFLAAILVLEQVGTLRTYEKRDYQLLVDRTSETLRDQKCEAFLFSPPKREGWTPALAHTVALWTSLKTGIPTVNAWTSADAPGWAFYDPLVSTTEDIARLRPAIANWRELHNGYPRSLCWIHTDLAQGETSTNRVEYPTDMKKNGPVAVSVTPDSGSGSSQTFEIKFSHKGGYKQLSDVRLLINTQAAGNNACYVYYSLPTNSLLLVNDAGNGSTSAVLGSGTSVQNSQCNVLTEGANAVGDGSGLSVSIPIRFKPTFAGQKKLILYAETTDGVNTDLVLKGLYEVIH